MNKKLKEAIEKCGWTVNSDTCIENHSPLGEDLVIECNNPSELVEAICDEYEQFDVDDHVELYVGMRGTNGVPMSIKSLVYDAEDIEKMLEELYNAITPFR
jgi:hypothetical protein